MAKPTASIHDFIAQRISRALDEFTFSLLIAKFEALSPEGVSREPIKEEDYYRIKGARIPYAFR